MRDRQQCVLQHPLALGVQPGTPLVKAAAISKPKLLAGSP